MAKVKYTVKENKTTGTHSFYAIPVPAGLLTSDEILEEALDGKSIEPSVARAAIEEYMKALKRNVLKGFRCQLGKDFLTVYPNLTVSVKDKKDKDGNILHVATAAEVTAVGARSRLGCTVSPKFSAQFAQEVSWQKVDQSGAAIDEEDITQGNENAEGTGDGQQDAGGEGGSSQGGSGDSEI